MRKTEMKRFKRLLEEKQGEFLYVDRVLSEDFIVNSDDRPDELDQASVDVEQSMRIRQRNREILFQRKIMAALKRIEEGSYGLCETCEEPIDLNRLKARLTSTLCVACKEESERREQASAAGRKHKSLGETLRRI